ncbi:FtsK/SpoIIIE domain-containing protein [Actinoplanes derwentensis]|uniref:FtsK/SpoIIIE family protein n=1 Tax=Actinoplanes derwentensis TaxID=113562 RepID=A0A1H2D419_9ACTN|nr:FtsK/SpoIIIE domain-containing protein [Actinoplanes derwentensis]GID85953.1 cell division protein FtsK [Actinoplanes derwentensis]SDT77309.1 FtsK/SpoIIIE family protein [Actinoplanes derwentensis]
MGSHRNALVAAIRQELAEARGTARAVLAAAESARGEAQNRRRLVRDAYATCLSQLASAREDARQDIRQRFHGEADRLAGHLRGLASASASGAAGTPWRLWAPSDPEPGRAPGLLRIGTIDFDETEALPGLIPLLDRAHLHLSGPQSTLDEVITGVLLRALGSTRAGHVELTVYDPERLGETLAVFAPLGTRFVGPGGLGPLLDELVDRLCRDEDRDGWQIVVLLADRAGVEEMSRAQRAQLDRIVRTGVGRGVHLVVRGMELAEHPSVERITVRDRIASCSSLDRLEVRLDPAPPPQRIAAFCREAADRLRQGPPPARLADLEPDRHWAESARDGLLAPIGDSTDGALVALPLGDRAPHILVGGPSDSGKTNLIYTWLGSLATRYGPAELALYLLDFTEGESFARYVPGPRDPSWLPQVRLAGINLRDDREFGLAVLRHLSEELDAPGRPRTVVVIDEFPTLLDGRDAIADEAESLLTELVRRGPEQGLHLMLSAQDGIRALTGRPAVLARFTVRIAMPKARRILATDNLAASLIPRFHTVVNGESGLAGANRIVRLPDAGDRTAWGATQRRLWRCRPAGSEEPRVFDGAAVPRLPSIYRPSGRVSAVAPPAAVLGERIDVSAQPARLLLDPAPGRNLAVLGSRADEACDVLAAAALSLAAQGPAHFSIVCLEPAAERSAARLVAELPAADWYDASDVRFEAPHSDVPRYVIGYGLDAAGARHRPALRALLTDGPQRHVHVLGWWRSVARLRDDLAGRFDPIGAWVALGVHGSELAPLHPQPGGPFWNPRPRRALFFDRPVHRTPEVIIPYEVNSDHT